MINGAKPSTTGTAHKLVRRKPKDKAIERKLKEVIEDLPPFEPSGDIEPTSRKDWDFDDWSGAF